MIDPSLLTRTRDFLSVVTALKMKFSIKDFFSKCDQIRSFLQIWSHLLKKSFNGKLHFCAVWYSQRRSRDSNKHIRERALKQQLSVAASETLFHFKFFYNMNLTLYILRSIRVCLDCSKGKLHKIQWKTFLHSISSISL